MTTLTRLDIPHCEPYAINEAGRFVVNRRTRKTANPISLDQAALLWNEFARGENLRGDVEGAGTSTTAKGRPVARIEELARDGQAEWLWINRSPCTATVSASTEPPHKILLAGDPTQHWFLIRLSQRFETLFHGPSMAAKLRSV